MARGAKPGGGANVKRVVVVGGGLAGISAALDCASDGATVTLLESRRRLGGAAYSFTRDGILADNGQHVFLRCCTAYRELLARIGASELVTLQPRLSIPVLAPGGTTAWLRRSSLPAPLHLAGSLLRYPFLGPAQRLSAARAMHALGRIDPGDAVADAQSFGEWLSGHGQGAEAVQTLWELIARPTLNLLAADASLAQAAYVFQEGLLRDPAAGDIGYARAPLGSVHDVMARRALATAGVDVRLGRGATAIEAVRDGFHVEVNSAPTLSADAVILAVPHNRVHRLLPPGSGLDRAQLAGLGTSPIVNVHIVFDTPVLDVPFAAGVHTPVQWIFDRTAPAGLAHGQYLVISLSAADAELDMTVDELRARFLPAVAALLPAAGRAGVDTFFVTREHAATFRAAPGTRKLRPGPTTSIRGLMVAGAWTDTGWPATMEGAVRSGRAAANAALRTLAGEREARSAVAV
jgi:hydroxysqualene dehydroxylase